MRRAAALALVLVAAAVAGCVGGSPDADRGPDAEPAAADVACLASDEFFLQRGGAGALTVDDPWQNRCPHAEGFVQMGGAGVINVTVKDADGETVLTIDTSPVTGGRQEFKTSAAGEPGTWRIEVTGAYAGGVQFSLTSTAAP